MAVPEISGRNICDEVSKNNVLRHAESFWGLRRTAALAWKPATAPMSAVIRTRNSTARRF
jgi:hypothetical protein